MDILEKLFGSTAKVKALKLFIFNPNSIFDLSEISVRTRVYRNSLRREVLNLEKMHLLRSKSFTKTVRRKVRGKRVLLKKRVNGWALNPNFLYKDALETFLSSINPLENRKLISKISRIGKIQLVIISGIFLKNNIESRVDLLIVGDSVKKNLLENAIASIESEMGREIRYAFFTTKDFQYRHSIFDKLIRDILDYPHQKLVNKIDL